MSAIALSRRLSVGITGFVIALALGACNDADRATVGELAVRGEVELAMDGGEFRPVAEPASTLRAGDVVRVTAGEATIGLGDQRRIELREGTAVRVAPPDSASTALAELLRGSLLVEAPDSAALVSAGGTTVSVSGSVRLTRGLSLVVGTYAGRAGVESAGREVVVPDLRQVSVAAAGLVPAQPSPIRFEEGDPWDERFLGEGIALGEELLRSSLELTSRLGPGEGRTPGFFRLLVPALEDEPEFGADLLEADRAPGETLVGAAIAVESQRGSFAERWAAVFRLHDEGAPWGIVALDQRVARASLVGRVDAALGRAAGLASGAGPPDEEGGGVPGGTGGGSPPPAPGGGADDGGADGGATDGGDLAGGGSGAGDGSGAGEGAGDGAGEGAGPASPPSGPTTPTTPSTPSGPAEPLERTTSSRLGSPALDGTVESLVDALGGVLRGLSLG